MTLTSELNKPDSPIRAFLAETFPVRHVVLRRWERQLWGVQPRSLGGGYATLLGSVFEILMALDLADHVPHEWVLDPLTTSETTMILTAAGFTTDANDGGEVDVGGWRKTLPVDLADPEIHDLLCLGVHVHELLRALKCAPESMRVAAPQIRSYLNWTTARPDERERWLAAQGQLWTRYTNVGRDRLRALGPVRCVRPVFDPAFAIGDFVVGDAIVEVKAYVDPQPFLETWMDQCLAYALLDIEDVNGIRSIAVYEAWRGKLLTADLATLYGQYRESSLSDLRAQFYEVARPAMEDSRRHKAASATANGHAALDVQEP